MQLNENQSMIRQMARDFANAKIAPIAHDIDKHGTFPEATVREMGELGFMGLSVPEAYGGSGADITSYALVVEELSRVCGSHGLTVAAHNSLGCWPIAAFGTEEQKRKYLPAAAAGKSLLSFGLTEAGAGSDAGGGGCFRHVVLQSTAVIPGWSERPDPEPSDSQVRNCAP